MADDLGFNPESVFSIVKPTLTMLIRANTPLTSQDLRNTLGTLEMIEAFDMTRDIILDHITPEEIVVGHGNPVMINTGKKRRKDKTFAHFWHDVAAEVEDCMYAHFTRTVELSTGTKTSIHPMIRRVMKLAIHPVLDEIGRFAPAHILEILDREVTGIDAQDIFGQMSMFVACGNVETQPTKIQVARKTLQNLCSSSVPKLNRIILIKKAAENVMNDKYVDETAPINQY